MPVGNIILVKMIDMKSIPVLLSCRLSIHVYAIKELTENQNEIFNRNKISYRFEFISPLM